MKYTEELKMIRWDPVWYYRCEMLYITSIKHEEKNMTQVSSEKANE